MKKLFTLGLIAFSILACKEDPPPVADTYPTDGLPLEEKTRAMLIVGYEPTSPASISYDILRKINEDVYGKSLNNISLVSGGLLGNPLAGLLAANFGSPAAPYALLNGEQAFMPELVDEIEDVLEEKPLLSVAHKVSSNDTAWIVDSKVKFFKDTLTAGIFIETYMLAKIEARQYDMVDLRIPEVKDFIKNTDEASVWQQDIPNIDSSSFVVKNGDIYNHNYILLSNFNESDPFGTQLGEYWPFGGEFIEGDVIGTRDTPIRHHFLKPEEGDFDFDFKPQFITVVWMVNPFTSAYDYVNSYSTE